MKRKISVLIILSMLMCLASCGVKTEKIHLAGNARAKNEALSDFQLELVDKIVRSGVKWYNSTNADDSIEFSKITPTNMKQNMNTLKASVSGSAESVAVEPALKIGAELAVLALSSPFDSENNSITVSGEELDKIGAVIEEAIAYYYD